MSGTAHRQYITITWHLRNICFPYTSIQGGRLHYSLDYEKMLKAICSLAVLLKYIVWLVFYMPVFSVHTCKVFQMVLYKIIKLYLLKGLLCKFPELKEMIYTVNLLKMSLWIYYIK